MDSCTQWGAGHESVEVNSQSHREVGLFFGTNRTIMEVTCVYIYYDPARVNSNK